MMVSVYLTHRWALTHGNGCSNPSTISHTNKGSHTALQMRAAAQATPPSISLPLPSAAFPRGRSLAISLPGRLAGERCCDHCLPSPCTSIDTAVLLLGPQ